MQFLLTFKTQNGAELPLNYGHYVQSMIYNILRSSGTYSRFLHDEGHTDGKKAFRLFTFSKLTGKYEIQNKRILFPQEICLEVRSADEEFCGNFQRGLHRCNDLFLGRNSLTLKEYEAKSKKIMASSIIARTITPVSVYITEPGGKRFFISPEENDFERLVQANFSRKFKALYDIIPVDGVNVSVIETGRREATYFGNEKRGSWIFGWHGKFMLSGNPRYLEFLYDTGLGSKNSQGFGMFETDTAK